MQKSTLLKICAARACVAALPIIMARSDPTVNVTGGQIRGRALQNGAVFKGVPFASPFPEATRGAEHSGELRYVFGNFPPSDIADSEHKISNDMQTYWSNYAKTGDPNGTGLPTGPKFDVKARAYLEFTDNGPVAKEDLRGPVCRFFEDFIREKIANQ